MNQITEYEYPLAESISKDDDYVPKSYLETVSVGSSSCQKDNEKHITSTNENT